MADINTGLQELEVVKQAFKSNISETGVSTSAVEFRDMPNLIKQLEKKYPTQKKTASPSRYSQTISADSGYRLSQVEVKPVTSAIDSNIIPDNIKKGVSILGVQGALEEEQIDLQAKFVEPKKTAQTILPDSNYDALSRVEVGAVTSAVDKNIQPAYIKKGVDILGVVGTLEGTMSGRLQEKTVTPTTSVQNIFADAGYDGLSRVSVQAVVPSKYYKPEQSASVTPKTTSQTITPSDNYVFNRVDVSAVTSAIDPNIKAENIKKGVSILGVTGNMQEVGGSPKFAELVDGSITTIEASDLADVSIIRAGAFGTLTSLVSVSIPDNVQTIGASAFDGCTSLQSLSLGNGIQTIGASAFENCAISILSIPQSVVAIGENAFAGTQLTEVYMESMTPSTIGTDTFPTTAQIYVPYGAYDDYVASWTDYASQIVRLPAIPSTITVIVNDYTGALVSGASVTISGNGQEYTGTTDSVGVFTQGDLQPATYTVSVADMEGFKTPVSSEVVVEEDTQNSVTITYLEKPNMVTYGVRIDLNNSDPEASVTYTDDAVGFEKSYMDFENDTFVWGSWRDAFPFNQIKPCILKDGVVTTYLNPNDYSKDISGNTIDLTTNCDGDVMIEIPKIYYRLHKDDSYQYIQISDTLQDGFCSLAHTYKGVERDKIYIGAYGTTTSTIESGAVITRSISGGVGNPYTITKYRTFTQNKGERYEILSWNTHILLQCLYVIQCKNLNCQEAIGTGVVGKTYSVDDSEYAIWGSLNNKGLSYGTNTNHDAVKYLGMENLWGNKTTVLDGIIFVGSSVKIADVQSQDMAFSDTGTGYISKFNQLTEGYATSIIGDNLYGFLQDAVGGSDSTFYCDNFGSTPYKEQCSLYVGGYNTQGKKAGIFAYGAHTQFLENAMRSSRIMYFG